MLGHDLLPASAWETQDPQRFQNYLHKYQDHPQRQKLPYQEIPRLNCRWMDVLNRFKAKQLEHLAEVKSFSKPWATWSSHISHLVKSSSSEAKGIYDLGDNLSSVFQGTGRPGRGQQELSGGGAAWECLVCWYLNLVCWNTPIVIAKANKRFVPKTIYDGISVNIENFQTNLPGKLSLHRW